MSPRPAHEHPRDDLAAYALGALPTAEAGEIEDHLGECESCLEYVRWLQPAVDVLPASVEQLAPPPGLGERLMATVRDEARSREEARRRALEPGRGPGWRGLLLRPAVGFAAAAMLLAGAVTGYLLGDSGGEPEVTPTEVRAAGPQASAELVRDDGRATLSVAGWQRPPEGSVYKIWVQREGRMEPSTTFVPERDGSYEAVIDRPLEGAEAVLVTQERRPATRQPTPPVLARAELG